MALPLFCFLWIVAYYAVCDYFGFFRLQGARIVWDVYLTALFYVVQFIGFHLYDYYTKHKRQELFALELRELALQ
ncbi:MAG: sensor histidine kinase, partial [Bacteroidota bacterium]